MRGAGGGQTKQGQGQTKRVGRGGPVRGGGGRVKTHTSSLGAAGMTLNDSTWLADLSTFAWLGILHKTDQQLSSI